MATVASACTYHLSDRGRRKKLRPSTMRKIAEALGVHTGEVAEFTKEDTTGE